MMPYLLAASYTSIEVRLTEMLIGRNVSGYTASRSGRLFDEVMGVIYVSRPNVWVRLSQPFAACSDLKVLYDGQPADVRLLASPLLEGAINVLAWSPDRPDRMAVMRLKTSLKSDTERYEMPGFKLRMENGKVVKKDTSYTLVVSGSRIKCEEEEVRLFPLGKALKDPTFIWTGREVWVLDGRDLYAYRKGKLVRLRTFKDEVFPTADGEGTVAFYSPRRDRLLILRFSPGYSSVSSTELKGISKDVRGEFVSIHSVREVKRGEGVGTWSIILTFRKGGKRYYVKVRREGKGYTVESEGP